MPFTPAGIEAQVKNLSGYLSGIGKMNSANAKLGGGLTGTANSLTSFGGGLLKLGGLAGGLALTGITALTGAATGLGIAFAKSATKEGMEFTKAMSNVGAIARAGAADFSQLENAAKNLGRTTKFTASEAAEGMSFLAMAGFETTEIIQAMPGVLNLAAASNMDLAKASDIVSNVLTGFGKSAEETSRFVDVLTKTAITANTNVEQLGAAMKFAAPTANALGVEVEDASAAIAALSDAGIQGALAGTSLRSIMLSLAAPTNIARKAMDDLGLYTGLTDQQFQNVQKSAADVADKISKVDTSFDERQLAIYQQELGQIVAKYGEGSIQAEKKQLAIDELTASIDEQRAKESELVQQQEALNNSLVHGQSAFFNLDGTMKPLPDIIEAIANATEGMSQEQAIAATKAIVGTRQFSAFQVLIKKGPDAMREYADELRDSMGTASEVAGKQLDNLSGDLTLFQSALSGIKIDAFQAVEPLFRGLVKVGTDALGKITSKLTEFKNAFASGGLFGKRSGSFGSAGLLAAMGIPPNIVSTIQTIFTNVSNAFDAFQSGIGFFDTSAGSFSSKGILSILGIPPGYQTIIQGVTTTISGFFTTVQNLIGSFQRGGVKGLAESIGITPQVFELFTKFQTLISNIGQSISTALGNIDPGSFSFLDTLNMGIEFLNQNFDVLMGAIAGIASLGIVSIIASIGVAIASLLTPVNLLIAGAALLGAAWAGNWYGIRDVALAVFNVFANTVFPALQQAFVNITAALNSFGLGWGDVFTAIATSVAIVVGTILTVVLGLVSGFANAFVEITAVAGDFVAGFTQALAGIGVLVLGVVEVVKGVFSGDWQRAWQGGQIAVEGFKNILQGFLQGIGALVQGTLGAVIKFIQGFAETVYEVANSLGADIVAGIAKGIDENAQKVYEVIKSMVKAAIDSAMGFLGIHSPSKVFEDMGANTVVGFIRGVDGKANSLATKIQETIAGPLGALRGSLNDWVTQAAQHGGLNDIRDEKVIDDIQREMRKNADKLATGVAELDKANNLNRDTLEKLILSSTDVAPKVARDLADSMFKSNGEYKKILKDMIAGNSELVEAIKEAQRQFNLAKLGLGSALLDLGTTALDRFAKKAQETADKVNAAFGTIKFGDEELSVTDIFKEINSLTLKALKNQGRLTLEETNRLYNLKQLGLGAVAGNREEYEKMLQVARDLNRAEEQRLAIEKQQADLKFLQQQLSLIQTLKDFGLNPADIFGGLEFGLNASLADLIEATRRATEAIINQVNSDLQISSPSRVMAKIGKRIMQGLQTGMADEIAVIPPPVMSQNVAGMMRSQSQPVNTNTNNTLQVNNNGSPFTVPMLRRVAERTFMGA